MSLDWEASWVSANNNTAPWIKIIRNLIRRLNDNCSRFGRDFKACTSGYFIYPTMSDNRKKKFCEDCWTLWITSTIPCNIKLQANCRKLCITWKLQTPGHLANLTMSDNVKRNFNCKEPWIITTKSRKR